MDIGNLNIGSQRRRTNWSETPPDPRMPAQNKHPQSPASPTAQSSNPPKGSTTPIIGNKDNPHIPSTKAIANLGFAMDETKEHPDNIAKLGVGAHAATEGEDEVTRPRRHHRQEKTNP
jgi:hypothetical protein